ncbi:MAG: HAMP domain-containing histidine kinase [Oscillospiraceae bacterium]|nr:HAMP domain-containing histidine kinase [Oscillospiraceae bacterium]
MKNFCQKRWARAMALILFCLCTAVSFVCGFLYNYGLQDGWYSDTDGFEDSALCRDYIQDCLSYVAENLLWLGDPTDTTLGEYGGEAFSYTITQIDTGEVTADTTTEDSVYVMDYDGYTEYGEEGVIVLTVDAGAEDVIYASEYNDTAATPEPLPTENASASDTAAYEEWVEEEDYLYDEESVYYLYESNYIISGYVNLPVEPYDGCYGEYLTFTRLFEGRDYYLAVCVGCGAMALLLLALALTGAILAGKEGKKPVRLFCLPFEILALGLFICTLILWNVLWELAYDLIFETVGLYIPFSFFRRMLLFMAIGLGSYILAAQISARLFLKNLILRRMAGKLPIRPILRGLIMVVLGVQCGFGLFVFYADGSLVLFYLSWFLLAADMLLLAGFIRWCQEEKSVHRASQALADGNLSYKVDARKLHLTWKSLGQNLNSIGDGMALAVEERMRSERMKTELITNVSHDLKTPLTSIINYIDLLKDESLPVEQHREYIDVLERQSAKLKKLTEDVVEASKAVSGAIEVNWEELDVTELLEQSVGEYSERLQAAEIEPVVHMPQDSILLLADGRLLCRVLDNLITNILKYAQPGTRAYFDLSADQGRLEIAIKNISKAPLDIPAEELMERFVRGDSSRSSEGSGLGLSIALSLTKLMGGELELILDGDLFKALITFPYAATLSEVPDAPADATASE